MPIKTVIVRPMQLGEETAVFQLVERVFNEFVAPSYSAEGIAEFFKYAQAEALAQRSQDDHFVLLAVVADQPIGMIEIRDHRHVSMLFVDRASQRQGIGGELLRQALVQCREAKPDLNQVTVHAAPNSLLAYERLGFRPLKSEQVSNGIRFVPMILDLA